MLSKRLQRSRPGLFSGDKLLGGPQAGIIAGKKQLIEKLRKEPMLRAFRVCKTTLALLETACSYYLNEKDLNSKNTIFRTFNRKTEEILAAAIQLQENLLKRGIASEVIASEGQCGGGALPDAWIASYAVKINYGKSNKESSAYAEKMHHQLLQHHQPVLGILRQGNIMFDLLTTETSDLSILSNLIAEAHEEVERLNG
jgi:L-seryl-tRNA(Ser) seleniumtransferase